MLEKSAEDDHGFVHGEHLANAIPRTNAERDEGGLVACLILLFVEKASRAESIWLFPIALVIVKRKA